MRAEDIEKIAHLARISIDATDVPKYAKEISNILSLGESMQSVNTDDISPMAHPIAEYQRLRIDEVTAFDEHKMLQENAPLTEAGLYLVPQVIEDN